MQSGILHEGFAVEALQRDAWVHVHGTRTQGADKEDSLDVGTTKLNDFFSLFNTKKKN